MFAKTDRKRVFYYARLLLPCFVVILLLVLAGTTDAAMQKKFQYSADVTLMAKNRYGTYGKSDTCYSSGYGSNSGELSTLLMWNISSLPKSSRITAATIELQIRNGSRDTFYVYGLRKRWTEYEASWEKANKSTWWSKPGASGYSDRYSERVGYLRAYSSGPASIALDPELVQEWLNNSQRNYGVIIAAARSYDDDSISFYCSETTYSTYRPRLVINYER